MDLIPAVVFWKKYKERSNLIADVLDSLLWENSIFLWIFQQLPAFVKVLINNNIQNADINIFIQAGSLKRLISDDLI